MAFSPVPRTLKGPKRMRITLSLLLFALLLAPHPTRAQAAPYITAATLYASVDYWGDIWINGMPVWGDLRYTQAGKGAWVNKADKQDSLCLFKGENLLAISLADSRRDEGQGEDYIGFAYVLILDLSDGSRLYLTSDEAGEHSSYYSMGELPRSLVGWQRVRYQEGEWYRARGTGTVLPGISGVVDPRTGQGVKFLSASGSNLVRSQGEQHLFRRRFYLNISPKPGCVPPTPTSVPKPEVVPEGARREPESFIPPPPVPTHTLVPTKTLTVTPTFTHLPSMPAKYLPSPQDPVIPTVTPRPKPRIPTPTATLRIISRETVEAIIRRAPALASPEFHRVPDLPVPTPTPKPLPPADVRFEMGAANIYVTFSDGPGRYKAQVEDQIGRVLKVLLDEKVVGESDLWLEWDGTNSQGAEVPAGDYQVVYSKDGKLLRTITVRK